MKERNHLKNWEYLEELASNVGVGIDPENPRDSRLRVAIAYDNKGDFENAINAMIGIPLEYYDPLAMKRIIEQRKIFDNPKIFYSGFHPVDVNNKSKH